MKKIVGNLIHKERVLKFLRILKNYFRVEDPFFDCLKLTCIDIKKLHMMSCDFGEINDGLFAVCLPALNILAIRFVFVSKAA